MAAPMTGPVRATARAAALMGATAEASGTWTGATLEAPRAPRGHSTDSFVGSPCLRQHLGGRPRSARARGDAFTNWTEAGLFADPSPRTPGGGDRLGVAALAELHRQAESERRNMSRQIHAIERRVGDQLATPPDAGRERIADLHGSVSGVLDEMAVLSRRMEGLDEKVRVRCAAAEEGTRKLEQQFHGRHLKYQLSSSTVEDAQKRHSAQLQKVLETVDEHARRLGGLQEAQRKGAENPQAPPPHRLADLVDRIESLEGQQAMLGQDYHGAVEVIFVRLEGLEHRFSCFEKSDDGLPEKADRSELLRIERELLEPFRRLAQRGASNEAKTAVLEQRVEHLRQRGTSPLTIASLGAAEGLAHHAATGMGSSSIDAVALDANIINGRLDTLSKSLAGLTARMIDVEGVALDGSPVARSSAVVRANDAAVKELLAQHTKQLRELEHGVEQAARFASQAAEGAMVMRGSITKLESTLQEHGAGHSKLAVHADGIAETLTRLPFCEEATAGLQREVQRMAEHHEATLQRLQFDHETLRGKLERQSVPSPTNSTQASCSGNIEAQLEFMMGSVETVSNFKPEIEQLRREANPRRVGLPITLPGRCLAAQFDQEVAEHCQLVDPDVEDVRGRYGSNTRSSEMLSERMVGQR